MSSFKPTRSNGLATPAAANDGKLPANANVDTAALDDESEEEYASDNEEEPDAPADQVEIDDEHVGEEYLDDDDQSDEGGFDEELDDAWRSLEEDDQTVIETIVPAEERVTSDRLSRYEAVELLSIRASAIERGAQCFVDTQGIRDRIEMAKKELYANRCPLLIKRKVGLGMVEIWDPNTMSKPLL